MATKSSSPSADCYLQFAHELREKCHRLCHIKGALKLERKIIAEIKFLRNLLRRNSTVQESHLKSSNLSHYAAIVHAAENVPGTIEILQPFSCPGKSESLIVDVVACQGHIWVKVIARKAQALHLVWAGKELYACRSAVDDFNTILSTLGGDGEKQRAAELLARVKVVEDKPSQKARNLQNLGKIKDRSKVIFGTGDSLEAITMTANSGFLRAAESQGVSFAVFVHAARALTEDKEKTATPI